MRKAGGALCRSEGLGRQGCEFEGDGLDVAIWPAALDEGVSSRGQDFGGHCCFACADGLVLDGIPVDHFDVEGEADEGARLDLAKDLVPDGCVGVVHHAGFAVEGVDGEGHKDVRCRVGRINIPGLRGIEGGADDGDAPELVIVEEASLGGVAGLVGGAGLATFALDAALVQGRAPLTDALGAAARAVRGTADRGIVANTSLARLLEATGRAGESSCTAGCHRVSKLAVGAIAAAFAVGGVAARRHLADAGDL